MDKKKFEAYLRDKLSVLNEAEIDEIVMEYLQHIDMRKADGVSEEEAIKDFGDVDDLVNDLLDAYKINRSDAKFESFDHRFKLYLNKTLDYINDVASALMKKDASEIISLIVQFLLVLVAIAIINGLVGSFSSIVYSLFRFLPRTLRGLIYFVIDLIRLAVGLSLSLAIIYWFGKERIIPDSVPRDSNKEKVKKSKVKNNNVDDSKEETAEVIDAVIIEETLEPLEQIVDEVSDSLDNVEQSLETVELEEVEDIVEDVYIESTHEDLNDIEDLDEQEDKIVEMSTEDQTLNKTIKAMPHEKAKDDKKKEKVETKSFTRKIIDFNLSVLRGITLIILIPLCAISLLIGLAYGILIYLTIIGAGSLGLVIIGAGVLLIGYYFVYKMIQFVGGKKK